MVKFKPIPFADFVVQNLIIDKYCAYQICLNIITGDVDKGFSVFRNLIVESLTMTQTCLQNCQVYI